MFKSLGLFLSIDCPAQKCKAYGCLYKHSISSKSSLRPVKRRRLENASHCEPHADSSLIFHGNAQLSHTASVKEGRESGVAKSAAVDETNVVQTSTANELETANKHSQIPVQPLTAVSVIAGDPRYIGRKSSAQQITIPYEPNVPVPHESRLHYLRAYKTQFERIYAPLAHHPDCQKWIEQDSIAQERTVLQRSGKGIYKQASRNMLLKYEKRAVSTGIEDRGIFPDYKPPLPAPELTNLVHSESVLRKAGFLTSIPEPDATMKNEEGQDRLCDRCGQRFIVSGNASEWSTCVYHPGKTSRTGKTGIRPRQWSCCTTDGPGCVTAKSHVFKNTHEPRLAAYHPFIKLPSAKSTQHIKVAALDCEMVYTTASMELARVVFTDMAGAVILDEYVLPENPILDLNTRFSGIHDGELAGKGIDQSELLAKMADLGIDHDTILVGHGLENDLIALRLVHHRLVDSAILFPHKAGLPYRNALKYLVKRYLAKDIQMNPINGQDAMGHDPAEDAKSALELVIWKAINGDKKVGDEPFSGKLK